MTSREEIALNLTKTILENSNVAKFNDVSTVVVNIYNDIYNNIESRTSKPVEVLK